MRGASSQASLDDVGAADQGRSGSIPSSIAPSSVRRQSAQPGSATPLTPAETAAAISAAHPNYNVDLVGQADSVVRVQFTSGNESRVGYVGNFNNIKDFDSDLAARVTEYLPQRSQLYMNRSLEAVDAAFRGSDVTSLIAAQEADGSAGAIRGMANITRQDAAFGTRVADAGGTIQVEDLRMEPVFFLAQVAGERGGGGQATALLHDVAKANETGMVATTFPANFWNVAKDRSGLYGPTPPAGNPTPDYAAAWQSPNAGGGVTALGQTIPNKLSLNPDRFGPDQGTPTDGEGRSIFMPMEQNPAFANRPGQPGYDPNGLETAGGSIKDADRVYYGWTYNAENLDQPTLTDIPLFVYGDTRLDGDPTRPGYRPGEANVPTRSYYPAPMQSDPGVSGPQGGPDADAPSDGPISVIDATSGESGLRPLAGDANLPRGTIDMIAGAIREQLNAGAPMRIVGADSSRGGAYSANAQYLQFSANGLTSRMQFVVQGNDAQAPYGDKDDLALRSAVYNDMREAQEAGACLFMWNCNTASIVARDALKDPTGNGPPIDTDSMKVMILVDETSSLIADQAIANGEDKVAIVGTQSTVDSGAYGDQVRERTDGQVDVQQIAAPSWAPMVNAGEHLSDDPQIRVRVQQQVDQIIGQLDGDVSTVYYTCTHYPALDAFVKQSLEDRGLSVTTIDPAVNMAQQAMQLILQEAYGDDWSLGRRPPAMPGAVVNTSGASGDIGPTVQPMMPDILNDTGSMPVVGGRTLGVDPNDVLIRILDGAPPRDAIEADVTTVTPEEKAPPPPSDRP